MFTDAGQPKTLNASKLYAMVSERSMLYTKGWASMLRTVVKVAYKDKYRMVGKVFTREDGVTIFYHRSSAKSWESDLDISLRGLDKEVVEWCHAQGVTEIHHDSGDALHKIPTELFLELADERSFHGRARLYVPKRQWDEHGHCWYKQPFIHEDQCKYFGTPKRKAPKLEQTSLF